MKPFVFQIVGYQNSGKTTFITRLLSRLQAKGIKTATIKHHGHGGKPAVAEGKDSAAHITAGAAASLVEGEGRLLLQVENADWTLEEKINLISMIKPDLILVEGHKLEDFPKAVFVRNHEDKKLLTELRRIELVLYHESAPKTNIVSFHRDDSKAIDWLVAYLNRYIQS